MSSEPEPIPFNRPLATGAEGEAVLAAIASGKLSGDGPYSKRCEQWFTGSLACRRALMVPSCTQALEMAALLLQVGPGDEVIMPSFTFVSTANAFALRGATVVFVDVQPDTMNLDPACVAEAITDRTRAIVPVHYAGVGCDMDALAALAAPRGIALVEDAAQGMGARYKGRPLGGLGALAALSFHETKNFTSGGEGGLLSIMDPALVARAEILREKGTNRLAFFRGEVDKYSWMDLGSSYLPGELQCAYLWAQLDQVQAVNGRRLALWHRYAEALAPLRDAGRLQLPVVPADREHNGHCFYVKARDLDERQALMGWLRERRINAPFHYVPLHSAPAGRRYGEFRGQDRHTTRESERLLRLPLFHALTEAQQDRVVGEVQAFFARH